MKLKRDFGVRALLATMVVGAAIIGAIFLIVAGKGELGMGFLSSAAMGALGFYFGARGGQGNGNPPNLPPTNNIGGT